ncbi:MAG: sterol desaturase family protein [Spirochaetia bacterium]|nr:sterol desaturase family protein [Spirochaetia bacterium]
MANKVTKSKTSPNQKKVSAVKTAGGVKKNNTKASARVNTPQKTVAKAKSKAASEKTKPVRSNNVKTSSIFDKTKPDSNTETRNKMKFPSIKEAMKNSNTIKMFKNPTIEKLSHVHPFTPLVIYIPVILISIYLYFFNENSGFFSFLIFYITGGFVWTISEYTLHRFVFHPPYAETHLKWFYFYVHGVHHEVPTDATRLVMPPGASIPLAIIVFFLFKALLPNDYLGFFAGFVTGYLVYDFLHFSTHFFSFEWEWFKKLKKHHNVHHYNSANKNFGVSNSLWDHVFSTKYRN